MIAIILAIVIGGARHDRVAVVDVIELNHCYFGDTEALTQVIFWDWSPDYRRYHCQGWAYYRGSHITLRNGGAVAKVNGASIRARIFRETFTDHDPERKNRDVFPEVFRRRLW